ncbi:glycogen debranching protein [Photobacterium japonica]|uniref:amylo-alpha-1,6-glucosidase n=1 Tax=Photobacterium japonica TaxID=2910235 RepID=UPI003D1372D1
MSHMDVAPFSAQLYVKGTFNGWGDDTPMAYVGNGVYQGVVCLSADAHSFKITDQQGTEDLCFAADQYKAVDCFLGQAQVVVPAKGIGNDLVFHAPETGLYTVQLAVTDDALRMTIDKGGDNAEEAAARTLGAFSFDVVGNKRELVGKGGAVLAPESLFEQVAITLESSAPFVFGDNVDGYYEGSTHAFVAAGKYRHKQGWYLGTFATFVDGVLNAKPHATQAQLFPYGVTHTYAQGGNSVEDTLMLFSGLHNGERNAAITVRADQPALLAVAPQLNLAISASEVTAFDHGVVYALAPELRQAGTPSFIALVADTAFDFEETTFAQTPALKEQAFFSGHHVKPVIRTKQPTTSMTVYLAFAETADAAIAQANRMLTGDGVTEHQQNVYDMLTHSYLWTSDLAYNRALMWAKAAGKVFVSSEYGKGIWAGLPWFKDCWGRDSFIAVPGITLVNGDFEDAKTIIDNFAQMQMQDPADINYGRIPNRVTSKTNMIYNTTDGTPWMVREVWDYLRYSGDADYAKSIYPVVQTYIDGIEKHYLDAYGLMTHRDPDTWMDAKLEGRLPWSARGDRANDIQALWYTSLLVAVELAKLTGDDANAARYQIMAEKVKASFQLMFWDTDSQLLADRLHADNRRDLQVRTNQLMTLTVPFDNSLLDKTVGANVVKNAISELLFPWGITSLSQHDPIFHPYHANREEYHKDAAYHNGTIWGWNAGFAVSSLIEYGYVDFAYQLTQNLADQILHIGHRGTMSENLDAFLNESGQVTTSGTYAQAWSVSEFTRNGYQDYMGFKPNLLDNKVTFAPCLPSCWQQAQATLRFGDSNALVVDFQRVDGQLQFALSVATDTSVSIECVLMDSLKAKHSVSIAASTTPVRVTFDPETATCQVNGEAVALTCVQPSFALEIGDLQFATPAVNKSFPMLNGMHVLQQDVEQAGLVNAAD